MKHHHRIKKLALCAAAAITMFCSPITVQAASATKTLYVVTKITEKNDFQTKQISFEYKGTFSPAQVSGFKGSLDMAKSYSDVSGDYGYFHYSQGQLISMNIIRSDYSSEYPSYKWNKSGKKLLSYSDAGSELSAAMTSNKKGQVTKAKIKHYSSSRVETYTYNKKGYLTKVNTDNGYNTTTQQFVYDSKGYVKKDTTSNSVTTYKNSYKSGRLVKADRYYDGSISSTFKISYKKVKVRKEEAARIQKQQRSLLLWYVYGFDSMRYLPLGLV